MPEQPDMQALREGMGLMEELFTIKGIIRRADPKLSDASLAFDIVESWSNKIGNQQVRIQKLEEELRVLKSEKEDTDVETKD